MKILPNGIAVLENDTHLSKWVEETGRIDAGHYIEHDFKHLIPSGGWVVDVGAALGDHTVPYARMVGSSGAVFAFEPQAEFFECLTHNVCDYSWIATSTLGLGDQFAFKWLDRKPNAGMACLSDDPNVEGHLTTPVQVIPLDALGLRRLHYMKIDVEGFDFFVLKGAEQTIRRCKPNIMIEISPLLHRFGVSYADVANWFASMNYKTDCNLLTDMEGVPMRDVIATPI